MKLSDPPPVRCSACFAQKVGEPHVDFEAAWDGPTFEQGVATDQGVVRNLTVSIDDLHICLSCLMDAGQHIGLGNIEEWAARNAELQQQNENLRERLTEADRYAELMERSVAAKPERRKPKRSPRKAVEA